MGLTVKRSEISCCEKVFEYSMPLEEASETVVPDTMPDVERILCADGTALIRSKELGDGHISLAGSVQCTVLYAPEGGAGICALDVGIPAALELDAPGVSEDSGVVAMLTAAAVEAKPLNPRKILVRAVVNVAVEAYNAARLDISDGLEGEGAESVETLCECVAFNPAVCVKEKTFVVSEDFRLQPGLLPIGSLLWHSTEICPGAVRSAGSRLVFNGTVRLSVMYEAEGSGELCSAQFETEFSQLLDTDMDLAGPDCCVRTMLSAEYVELDTLAGGERGVSAEFHLVSQCVCSDSVRAEVLTDCYSNCCELEVTREQLRLLSLQRRATVRAGVHDSVPASPLPVDVVRVICRPGAVECEGGALRCPVSVTAVYTASDGKVYSASRRLSCEAASELPEGEYAAGISACCVESGWSIASGAVDVRAAVDFELMSAREEAVSQISAAECGSGGEAQDRPSLVVLRAAAGDSLWSLGKRCHSTAALIAELNNLAEGERIDGRVLLIPAEHR